MTGTRDEATATVGSCPLGTGDDAPAELAGVLFDMDGTLTDSERLWTISLAEVAAASAEMVPP